MAREIGESKMSNTNEQAAFWQSVEAHLRSLTDAAKQHARAERDAGEQLEYAEWSIRRAYDAGHNDDCLFCGHKDRYVREYLQKYVPHDVRLLGHLTADEPQPDHFPDITEMVVQPVRETEQEPYGHCESCGKPCDGSGVCSCGGPIAIIKTEPFSKASFSKAQENVCECGHTATLHRFGSANFICRVMSPCSKCECPDFRWNYVPPSDEEIEAQAEADFYAIQKEQRSIK